MPNIASGVLTGVQESDLNYIVTRLPVKSLTVAELHVKWRDWLSNMGRMVNAGLLSKDLADRRIAVMKPLYLQKLKLLKRRGDVGMNKPQVQEFSAMDDNMWPTTTAGSPPEMPTKPAALPPSDLSYITNWTGNVVDPDIIAAVLSREASTYYVDPNESLFYAAQIPIKRIGKMDRSNPRKHLTTVQKLNSLPILLNGPYAKVGEFGQASGLISSIIGAASNVGGAAITAVLTPRPAGARYVPPQPVVIQQAAPTDNTMMYIGIAAGVLVLAVVIGMKK
jgi:hypothetical protein